MDRRAFSLPSLIWSAVMFILALLITPFVYDLIGDSGIGGVEGFLAKLIPFLMVWYGLTAGTRYLGAP